MWLPLKDGPGTRGRAVLRACSTLWGGTAKGMGRGVESPAMRWVEDAQLWARSSPGPLWQSRGHRGHGDVGRPALKDSPCSQALSLTLCSKSEFPSGTICVKQRLWSRSALCPNASTALLTVWCWASHLTPLFLGVLINKVGIIKIIITPTQRRVVQFK